MARTPGTRRGVALRAAAIVATRAMRWRGRPGCGDAGWFSLPALRLCVRQSRYAVRRTHAPGREAGRVGRGTVAAVELQPEPVAELHQQRVRRVAARQAPEVAPEGVGAVV